MKQNPGMNNSQRRKKVEVLIENQLAKEKEKFKKQIQGRESKFLFVLIQALNYLVGDRLIFKQDGMIDRIDIPSYRLLASLKAMLDIILQGKMSVVQMVHNDEFLDIFSTLRPNLKLGFLTHMFSIRKENLTNIKVQNGEILVTREESNQFYQAFQEWVSEAGLDSDWMNWYFSRPTQKRARVGTLLQTEFKKTYQLNLDDLTSISEYFKGISENHVKETSWSVTTTPLLYMKRNRLSEDFSKHMSQDDTKRWLKLLEYKPGGDFYRSPLISIIIRGKKAYTLMTWVFTPSNHFWGSWITDMLLDNLQLSAGGKWATQYGLAFQNYVDERLSSSGLLLKNLGSRKISVRDHPYIQPWLSKLQKEGFEIDRLIECGKTLFVISCKTKDFLYDRKVVRRDIFFPRKDLEERVSGNLRDMSEICIIADCVKRCKKLRRKLGSSANKFVPILLTSMKEPLGSPEIRSYYSSNRKMKLPKTRIVTISEFIELIRKEIDRSN